MSKRHPAAFPQQTQGDSTSFRALPGRPGRVVTFAFEFTLLSSLFPLVGCKRLEMGSGAQFSTGYNIDTLPLAPSNSDRDFTCPVAHPTLDVYGGDKVVTRFLPAGAEKATLWNGLTDALVEPEQAKRSPSPPSQELPSADRKPIAPDLDITVILVRRQQSVPYYLYLSNGTQDDVFQPWSSSKYMAFAALASRARQSSLTPQSPGGEVGIDGDVTDPNGGRVPIGDLVTEATTYEFSCFDPKYCRGARTVPHLTSNNVATWAKNLAGRYFSDALVRNWLGRPEERFDGGYQRYAPEYTVRGNGWGFTLRQGGNVAGEPKTLTLKPRPIPANGANLLSTHTMAEFLKRLVMHRENPAQAVPFVTWEDVKTILYGALPGRSKYFPQYKFGGMQGGSSTYIQAAFDKRGGGNTLESSTSGHWRTFTKIGWGPGGSVQNDFLWHGYGCVPRFDALGRATPAGREFFISARLPGKRGVTDAKQDETMTRVMKQLIGKVMNGELAPMSPTSGSIATATTSPAPAPSPTASPCDRCPRAGRDAADFRVLR